MNFLFYKWNGFMQMDLIHNLKQMGHGVDVIQYTFHDKSSDPFFERKFHRYMEGRRYDALISFNYFPILSTLCEEHGLTYLAWIYDSPSPSLQHIEHSCNRIFFFDHTEYQSLKQAGHTNVYHLPLAVDTNRLDHILPTQAQISRFSSDVSFVGKLYQREAASFYHTTSQARIEMLQQASNEFTLKLYSPYDTDTSMLPHVILQGPVDYYHEMPLVFRLSKINLNLTLSTIQSGIPLRILDILGAGGFLLTNHQPELDEYFIEGQDLVYYDSLEELTDKIRYYLSHETIRSKIARSGYQKVQKYYHYPAMITKMLQMAELT